MLRVLDASSADALALVDRRVTRDPALLRQVRTIVDAVRREGDAALARYARRFDQRGGRPRDPDRTTCGDSRPPPRRTSGGPWPRAPATSGASPARSCRARPASPSRPGWSSSTP